MNADDDDPSTVEVMQIPASGRGVVITDSSTWTFVEDNQCWMVPNECSSADASATGWVRWETATYFVDGPTLQLRIQLNDQPSVERATYTETVRWTNVQSEPALDERWCTEATGWFPASPVPADSELLRGELPFTAFGQFGPDSLDLRVFDQGVYWVDRWGVGHEIEKMSTPYRRNVAQMLLARADEFHRASVRREYLQALEDALVGRTNAMFLVEELGVGSMADVEASVWVASTPLMRALTASMDAANRLD